MCADPGKFDLRTGQLGNRRLEPPRFQAFLSKSLETLKGKPIWMAGPNDAVFHLYPYDTSDTHTYIIIYIYTVLLL